MPKQIEISDIQPSKNEGIWYDGSRDVERLGSLVSGPSVTVIQVCPFLMFCFRHFESRTFSAGVQKPVQNSDYQHAVWTQENRRERN